MIPRFFKLDIVDVKGSGFIVIHAFLPSIMHPWMGYAQNRTYICWDLLRVDGIEARPIKLGRAK